MDIEQNGANEGLMAILEGKTIIRGTYIVNTADMVTKFIKQIVGFVYGSNKRDIVF